MKSNSEVILLIRQKLESISVNQKSDFVDRINSLKALNASKGKLRAGGTIKEMSNILNELLIDRQNSLVSVINELPLKYSKSLKEELYLIRDRYFPIDYDDFRARYLDETSNIMPTTDGNKLSLDLAEKLNKAIIESITIELDKAVLILMSAHKKSALDYIFISIEFVLWLATAFMAGMWASDPAGNYEPWIVVMGLVAAGIEIFRQYFRKNA